MQKKLHSSVKSTQKSAFFMVPLLLMIALPLFSFDYKIENLVEKKWYISKKQKMGQEEMNKNRKDCDKETYIIFHKDKTYEWNRGKNRCNPNEPEVILKSTWKIDGKNILSYDEGEFMFEELTKDKLVFIMYESNYTVYYTMGLKPDAFPYEEDNAWDDIIVKEPIQIHYLDNCQRSQDAMRLLKKNKIKYQKVYFNFDELKEKMTAFGYKGVQAGDMIYMPVWIVNGRTYFHVDNLEQFVSRLKFPKK